MDKSMANLIWDLDLKSDLDYYERIVLSVKSNNFEEAKDLFLKMQKKNRKAFCVALFSGVWEHGLRIDKEECIEFIKLI